MHDSMDRINRKRKVSAWPFLHTPSLGREVSAWTDPAANAFLNDCAPRGADMIELKPGFDQLYEACI